MIETRAYEAALGALERAFILATSERDQKSISRSRGFALEKLHRYQDALTLYERMADETSAIRVRYNLQTLALMGKLEEVDPSTLDDGYVCPDSDAPLDRKRLEEELLALGDPAPH